MEGEGINTLLYSTLLITYNQRLVKAAQKQAAFSLWMKNNFFKKLDFLFFFFSLLLVTFNLQMSGCNLYSRGFCLNLKKGLLVVFRVFKWSLCYFSKFLDFTAREADGENITWKALSSSTDSEMLNPEVICICVCSVCCPTCLPASLSLRWELSTVDP